MVASRLELLHQVSRQGGACLREFFGTGFEIHKKGALDLVTLADVTCEKLVVETISALFPDDAIVAEEGHSRDGSSGYQWIIDPLDGTTNFAHAFPQFCVSIALTEAGTVVAGVVYDPIKEEFFDARLGGGARLNGQPITIGTRSLLEDALGVTGFSYDRRQRMDQLLERVRRILMNCQGMRRLGAAALDLAYVACGRFDVYFEDGLHAWDIAAGQLLVTEAGGLVSLLDGSALELERGAILAANPALHPQALEKLCRES